MIFFKYEETNFLENGTVRYVRHWLSTLRHYSELRFLIRNYTFKVFIDQERSILWSLRRIFRNPFSICMCIFSPSGYIWNLVWVAFEQIHNLSKCTVLELLTSWKFRTISCYKQLQQRKMHFFHALCCLNLLGWSSSVKKELVQPSIQSFLQRKIILEPALWFLFTRAFTWNEIRNDFCRNQVISLEIENHASFISFAKWPIQDWPIHTVSNLLHCWKWESPMLWALPLSSEHVT